MHKTSLRTQGLFKTKETAGCRHIRFGQIAPRLDSLTLATPAACRPGDEPGPRATGPERVSGRPQPVRRCRLLASGPGSPPALQGQTLTCTTGMTTTPPAVGGSRETDSSSMLIK